MNTAPLISTMELRLTNKKSHSVTELLVASAVAVLLTTCALQAFFASRQAYSLGTVREGLQQAASLVTKKIIEGPLETGVLSARLSEASSTQINGISDFQFTGIDGITRRYFLTGTQIIYQPNLATPAVQTAIYTAPPGAAVTLRFWRPHSVPPEADAGQYVDNLIIDVGISQQVIGQTVTGSVSTMVNPRNH